MHSFSGWPSVFRCALCAQHASEAGCPEAVACVIQATAGSCLLLKLRIIRRCRVQGPALAENDPVDHFQRGRAGRPRSGLPSLVGFGGLERPERLPVAGFQRKAGRKAPEKPQRNPIPVKFLFLVSCFNQEIKRPFDFAYAPLRMTLKEAFLLVCWLKLHQTSHQARENLPNDVILSEAQRNRRI